MSKIQFLPNLAYDAIWCLIRCRKGPAGTVYLILENGISLACQVYVQDSLVIIRLRASVLYTLYKFFMRPCDYDQQVCQKLKKRYVGISNLHSPHCMPHLTILSVTIYFSKTRFLSTQVTVCVKINQFSRNPPRTNFGSDLTYHLLSSCSNSNAFGVSHALFPLDSLVLSQNPANARLSMITPNFRRSYLTETLSNTAWDSLFSTYSSKPI